MDTYDLDQLREEILTIRDTGCCNMFDLRAVQQAANELDYFDLAIFIEDHKSRYVKFIFTGEFE